MAYKSKSKNTSRLTRVTRTTNTNGPSTYTTSTSLSGGNRKALVSTRISQTTKSDGKSYTTLTTRDGNGYISRKRIYSSAKSNKRTKGGGNTGLGIVLVGFILALGFLQSLFSK